MDINTIVKNSYLLASILPISVPWQPVKLIVAVTNSCNLKCTMCWRTINKPKNLHMSKDVFKEAISCSGGRSVAFMGNGEPLLHPNIFEFIEICRAKNIGIHLTTNGTLLTKDMAKALLSYPNIESILFSIDGVYENYNKIRVGADFESVINNLVQVSELRKGKYPSLLVNFVGTKSSIDDLPKLIKIVGNYVDSIDLIHPCTLLPSKSSEHLNRSPEHAKKVFRESIEVAHNVKLTLRSLKPYPSRCIIPWFAPYIGIEGDVYPCCSIGMNDPQAIATEYYNDMPIVHRVADYSVGNIMDSSLSRIWNGETLKGFRRVLKWVNSVNTKKEYDEEAYLDMLEAGTYNTFYCKVCPIRWNCSC